MLAPVYTQNARGRYVYLPENMMLVRLSSPENREYISMEKGLHYVSAELEQMIFFIKKDKIIPLATPGCNTDNMQFDKLELLCNVETECEYTVYNDDGFSKDYENPEHYTNVHIIRKEGKLSVKQSGASLSLMLTDMRGNRND